MKLKYYLRGIGIGVIVTTLIFITSISIHKNDVKREQQNNTQKSETVAQANKDTESLVSTESTETESQIPPGEAPVQPENNQNTMGKPERNDPLPAKDPENPDLAGENVPDTPAENPVEPAPQGGEIIQFVVGKGEFSDIIAGKLAEQKLIDNAEAFNKFLIEKNYDNFILPGTYAIPMDSTYEEIAALLTTKVE